jgi:hypothetical protein
LNIKADVAAIVFIPTLAVFTVSFVKREVFSKYTQRNTFHHWKLGKAIHSTNKKQGKVKTNSDLFESKGNIMES